MIGLYEIRNKIDGKKYIGSSCHLARRLRDHKSLLNRKKHHCIKLQRAWDLHGGDCFEFTVIRSTSSTMLKQEEQILLDEALKNRKEYYNISINAHAPTRGLKFSEDTKNKLRALRSTDEWKQKQSASLKEYFSSPEARQKASEAGKLKWKDESHRKKCMEAVAKARLKPEVKQKMSDCHKGIKQSEATKQKKRDISNVLFADPAFKQKFRNSMTEEVKKKMSEAKKKYFSDPENKRKQSERTKAFFANPVNRQAARQRQFDYLKTL